MATPKEVQTLSVALHLAEKELVDSSERSSILADIKYMLDQHAKKRKHINKKRKKEEQESHERPHSQQLLKMNRNKLVQGKQLLLHQEENKVQVVQQQHSIRPMQVPNVAQTSNFGFPLYASMTGIHSYPAQQPVWPGAQGRPFAPQLRAPQYMGTPFSPLPLQPPFCPR
jgi:flagellar biosynthesis GTPase FlhF